MHPGRRGHDDARSRPALVARFPLQENKITEGVRRRVARQDSAPQSPGQVMLRTMGLESADRSGSDRLQSFALRPPPGHGFAATRFDLRAATLYKHSVPFLAIFARVMF